MKARKDETPPWLAKEPLLTEVNRVLSAHSGEVYCTWFCVESLDYTELYITEFIYHIYHVLVLVLVTFNKLDYAIII